MAKVLSLGGGRGPSGSVALKKTAKHLAPKKATKHAAKKATKHAAKKAAKKAQKRQEAPSRSWHPEDTALAKAYHHLQRAGLVLSLVEPDSGSDLRALLQYGVQLYDKALREQVKGNKVRAGEAHGILRAAEHLSMASFYSAREGLRPEVPAPEMHVLESANENLGRKLEKSKTCKGTRKRLKDLALELIRRSDAAADDPHLSWELFMAAEGLWTAIEEGDD